MSRDKRESATHGEDRVALTRILGARCVVPYSDVRLVKALFLFTSLAMKVRCLKALDRLEDRK